MGNRNRSKNRYKNRHKIHEFIRSYVQENGQGPMQMEIAEAVGCAQSTVNYHLRWLKSGGYITYEHRRFRSIKVLEPTYLP